MEFWSIVQEACGIVGVIFVFPIGVGLFVALVYWVFFLLGYPMTLALWMLEKILPPFPRKEERTHRREPEVPPPAYECLGKEASDE